MGSDTIGQPPKSKTTNRNNQSNLCFFFNHLRKKRKSQPTEDISAVTNNVQLLSNKVTRQVFIDAGIEHIHVRIYDTAAETNVGKLILDQRIPNNDEVRVLFSKSGILDWFNKDGSATEYGEPEIYITGKLAEITKKVLNQGESILPAAVLWSAGKSLFQRPENKSVETIGIIDLSASGYMVIGVDRNGELKDDLLIVNPRCGAGTGVNLSRILEKLDLNHEAVDRLLVNYLGAAGQARRAEVPVRSDRCGVFSSSATISDKNQGIPLDYALAVTMKSEVMKPCRKMLAGIEKVYLTGGVFKWQYARDCAEDFLKSIGAATIVYDEEQSIMLTGMQHLVQNIGSGHFRKQNPVQLRKPDTFIELPAFSALKEKYENKGLYERMPDPEIKIITPEQFTSLPVNVGLDIGSTMAKIVVTDARSGDLLFKNSYNNHGDTIETIKHIFRTLKAEKIDKLKIQNIGVTGSGRYQVQRALQAIYPHIKDRISVLVENYAHARGSIQFVKDHIHKLKQQGFKQVNEDFCLLIDIGGEDTKISVISLQKEELFDNAMNIKCSAGTGSLMDTLKTLFDINEIAVAYRHAFEAPKAYGINATCAVFLMENARKMQAEGFRKDEILASCCYAIVENMARSLWDQVDFPQNTVALLHGQTMLSDPLPLAVTQRIQEYTGSTTYCLVPPLPGHRACIGLVKSTKYEEQSAVEEYCYLDDFIERKFEKKIIFCRGAACGDKNARCARTRLTSTDVHGKISLTLGGCTAVNELEARKHKGEKIDVPDAYRAIWNFFNNRLPKSDHEQRVVIPRCFSVSEKSFFLANIFEQFGIPVHVDNVQERDIVEGQPLFPIDTCAPNIGAAGQFMRLARAPHGLILVPQIDFLPIDGKSVGRTCTTNQGGILIAHHFAKMRYPDARFKLFALNLREPTPQQISDQLYDEFQTIFDDYQVKVSRYQFIEVIQKASAAADKLKAETAELAADFIEEAIHKKLNISIISAREYVLNPGIYDSHIGKLLKDKGVVAIPTYVFENDPDQQFDYIFWKNPHDLMSKSYAITNKCFHKIIKHPRLKELVKKIETGDADILMSVVTVSTFRCGPDSITLPVLAEITKNVPSLLIQSDAMIAELAHLENRVNTHLNQLNKSLHRALSHTSKEHFSIRSLSQFTLNGLNPKTDVLYFPTMNDNRPVTAVFKAAGVTVIDNFDDAAYDLEAKAKIGRKYVGDAACAPLAAVFADMLNAVDDFVHRKQTNDPLVKGKTRIVLFMHYGDGPCRQGQYVDICKLNFYKILGNLDGQPPELQNGRFPIKFLENIATSLHNKQDYIAELEKWTVVQGYQGIIMKGVLHSMFLKASSNCQDFEEFEALKRDFINLKQTVYEMIEYKVKPNRFSRWLVKTIENRFPRLGGPAQYFGYGLYNNNGFRKVFKAFGDKWIRKYENGEVDPKRKVKVYVDGEIYLRVAQLDEILKSLIDTLGFGAFELNYTAVWCYFEYILEARILIANQDIEMYENKLKDTRDQHEQETLLNLIQEKKQIIRQNKNTINNFRNILAGPLYRAAGLEMPERLKNAIAAAKMVIPKYRPFGELVPFVGETILQLNHGTNLVLNVAPEGCMVASMGEMLTPKIMQIVNNPQARIQFLSTTEGEVNMDVLRLSLLKLLGPEGYYSC